MPNLNNEGFTITPRAECVGRFKPVFWTDDAETGGNAVRAGTLNCTPRVAQTVAFTSTAPSGPVVGQTYTAAATGGASGNPVVLSIAAGSSGVCSITGAVVRFDHPGSCVVRADQAGNDDFAPGSAQQTITVVKALTETIPSVTATTLRATVTVRTPGAGTPTGSVAFLVDGVLAGTAPLTAGVATLSHVVPSGATRHIVASYLGDPDFSSSGGTTNRRDPSMTARLVPAGPASASGWYGEPVQVVFTCVSEGSPLTCPAPVLLSSSGVGQTVTRTVTAADGGSATATAGPVDIDLEAPTVSVAGVKDGKTYKNPPSPRCKGSDALSGVDTCTVTVTKKGKRKFKVVVVATDLAGNTATATKTYRLAP